MAYDAVRQVTILFGGMIHGTPAKPVNDTWAYDGKNWKKLSPKTWMLDMGMDRSAIYNLMRRPGMAR